MKSSFRIPRVVILVFATCFLASCFAVQARPQDAASPAAMPAPDAQTAPQTSPPTSQTISIPGPLRSFLRMSAISQKVSPDEIAPLMSRNIFLLGYEGPQNSARETEYLVLLNRYVQQARELVALAGPTGIIHVSNCEDAKPLLGILGYRERPDCGQKGTFVETVDPQKAFLTIDSGFPLPDLEKVLQEGKPFGYSVPTSRVPVLFTEADWVSTARRVKAGENKDLIDTLMHDPMLARLYWAMGRIDRETQGSLRQSPGLKKLYPLAAVLDFYGSHIRIRDGRVLVPGGSSAEGSWKELVGANPDNPGDFVFHLLSKDSGWLAAYFDSLSRVNRVQQAHFTEPHRLRRDYEALRGKENSSDAARGVFRSDPRLLLLMTRAQWDPNGEIHIPGNIEVWRQILAQRSDSPIVREWGRRARHWDTPEHLLEGMFALSRVQSESGPLQAYLFMSALDSRRPADRRLSPETVVLVSAKFSEFSDQYLMFSEFPELDDTSIANFISAASALDGIKNQALRGNAMGTFQAAVSIWQILARQNEIPREELNASFQKIIKPWGRLNSQVQLFDDSRASLREVALAATGKPEVSQDQIIELLAGPLQISSEGQRMHQALANRMRAVLDAQRLISLDTILTLGDGLHDVSYVKAQQASLLPLASELREFEMPQPIFKNSERDQWAAGIYNNKHTETQMHTDLTKIIKSPNSAEQLAEARGHLASLLRDTLVGLNYAYYEPPGAQILHNNPLFVRSHDFSGDTVTGVEKQAWQASQLFGAGSPAGGGARLVGSLADLPYVLADAEQDFIAPENVQALIWRQVVPGLLTSAVVPRWWGVSQAELHAVALYQRSGEELLIAAQDNDELRGQVSAILSDRMSPQRLEFVDGALRQKHGAHLALQLMPADTFYLSAEYRRRFPDRKQSFGPNCDELDALAKDHPDDVSIDRLSRDFGVPHPALEQTYAQQLLNVQPFPAFMGYSSRFLAESWDSNNLYWARLADEKGYSPVVLNRLVPELTRRMVEKIFATDLEDWPALLRATRETGDEFRLSKPTVVTTTGANAPSQP
ncbi:MAG: hypothetical protein WA715_29055 [Candidatus Acidiferrum sp.]